MEDKKILEVINLKKHFKVKGSKQQTVHAVDGISFSIKRGQTFGLVGESGCGKSTAARTIIRIYSPTSGQVFIDGEDISKKNEKNLKKTRQKMQMIFQDPYSSLNARMTVRDIIAEPLIAHGYVKKAAQADDIIYQMLNEVGLNKDHLNRYPHEFSGGQRQRIGIARALIIKPKIIICDEPISALDMSIQAQVVNLLKKFQDEQNFTYLFIAHDLSMVRYMSDNIGVMYIGKLLEVCESEEIYQKPLHPYTQGLLGSIPIPDPVLAAQKKEVSIMGDIASPINPPMGCRFHTRCKYAMGICREKEPILKDAGSKHYVACHLI